ncbi:MAG: hypothetical protein PHP53_24225 [Prolixibacteraceae bacterium]|nr:hypothetical protein [Prolixibacteraceae bacterium]
MNNLIGGNILLDNINLIFTGNGAWLFPLILLSLQLILKLVVLKRPQGDEIWDSILAIPVDLEFLAISFVFAAALIAPNKSMACLGVGVVFVVVSVVSIIIWAASPKSALGKHIVISTFLLIVNFCISLTALTAAIKILKC